MLFHSTQCSAFFGKPVSFTLSFFKLNFSYFQNSSLTRSFKSCVEESSNLLPPNMLSPSNPCPYPSFCSSGMGHSVKGQLRRVLHSNAWIPTSITHFWYKTCALSRAPSPRASCSLLPSKKICWGQRKEGKEGKVETGKCKIISCKDQALLPKLYFKKKKKVI